jgi:arylsulfatase A-like enzyme
MSIWFRDMCAMIDTPNRYKMNYFEHSVRVPLLISHPKEFQPHRVSQNVSTLDILPTMCDLVGTKPWSELPMDGLSLLPHLQGSGGHDKVYCEYTGEGTIRPLCMIKDGPWKYVVCPADEPQLFNLARDPLELNNLARTLSKVESRTPEEEEARVKLEEFAAEARERWDFDAITKQVIHSQRNRRLVWGALRRGKFTSWDYNPVDDGTSK